MPLVSMLGNWREFWGEREGPRRDSAGEGEVGSAVNWCVGPPHPALSPPPAGGEGKRLGHSGVNLTARVSLDFPRTALRFRGNGD